ncbi:MAG TPA: Maf family protein [Spirochaetales bacterium]|nr:Maf family protein [Spirochaetales bacterium]
METLLLASSSPRRKDILRSLSVPFISIDPDIDESIFGNLTPEMQVIALSKAKALEGCQKYKKTLTSGRMSRSNTDAPSLGGTPALTAAPNFLLAADTLVAYQETGGDAQIAALTKADGWHVIGKPECREDARLMLERLQGRSHFVFTALCLVNLKTGDTRQELSRSTVRFAPMSQDEIQFYLNTEEWQGVAGAYRLQGKGAWFIESIEGSPSGVMGLPIRELYGILKKSGYTLS